MNSWHRSLILAKVDVSVYSFIYIAQPQGLFTYDAIIRRVENE